jgi:proline dehydrogenase
MRMFHPFYRKLILYVLSSRIIKYIATHTKLRLGAQHFIAGDTREEALQAAILLNDKGILCTLHPLWDNPSKITEAEAYKRESVRLLEGIAEYGLQADISLRPIQLGLGWNDQNCLKHMSAIVHHADEMGCKVQLYMEQSDHADATLQLLRKLRYKGYSNITATIQARLYRSELDIRRLTQECMPLILVKGAYLESHLHAYWRSDQINSSFRKLLMTRLKSGVYTAIATHDEQLIAWSKQFAMNHSIPKENYEFQMRYGVLMPLQQALAEEGYRVRCLVPYGKAWYSYVLQRLAEHPAYLGLIFRKRHL